MVFIAVVATIVQLKIESVQYYFTVTMETNNSVVSFVWTGLVRNKTTHTQHLTSSGWFLGDGVQ